MPNHYTNVMILSGYDDAGVHETFNAEKFETEHAKTNWCERVILQPDGLDDPKRPHVLTDAAHQWQRDNWGVKWGAYGSKCLDTGGDGNVHIVTFLTPWGPPTIIKEIAEHIAKLCGFERYAVVGFDPFDGNVTALANVCGSEEFE